MFPFSDSEDLAHFFFALPVFLVASFEYVLCFSNYKISEKRKQVISGWLVIALGAIIFAFELNALNNCRSSSRKNCFERNIMHVLFGSVMLEGGILMLLYQTKLFRDRSVSFYDSLLLILIGVFMGLHIQTTTYGWFIHRAYGIITITAGILRLFSMNFPMWKPFASVVLMASSVTFIFGSKTTTKIFAETGGAIPLFCIFAIILGWVLLLTVVCIKCFSHLTETKQSKPLF